jgi:hypothetical protein
VGGAAAFFAPRRVSIYTVVNPFIGPMARHKNNKFIAQTVLNLESLHAKNARTALSQVRRDANKNTVKTLR